jgi:transketolase
MAVIVPSDAIETREAVISEVYRSGPAYIRLNRSKTPILMEEDYTFNFGDAVTMREGSDLAIIATGTMVHTAMEASELLKKEKIESSVINIHTIKPLDNATVVKIAKTAGAVITMEEHSIYGGLGGAIAEVLGEQYPVPVKKLGVNDVFGESGNYEQLLEKHGLTAMKVAASGKKLLRVKK